MESLGINQNDDISAPRRRLTQDSNGPLRFSLFKEKQTQENSTQKSPNIGSFDFIIDSSFDLPRSNRRRTIQRDEILNSQAESNILTQRKRPALDDDRLETRHFEKLQSSTLTSKDKDIAMMKEKIALLENHVEDLVMQYEELKNLKSTEQENALVNHLEWAQARDDAYITLRDQSEELSLSTKPNMHNGNTTNTNIDQTKELKARVANLEKQLEERNAEVRARNRSFPDQDTAKLIYNLYEDLTGVIITEVKKGEYENAYKCVISGKTGTFRFSLAISKEQNGIVYYSPVLDPVRDAKLMSTLPEFLKESVEFERNNLPIVFSRLSSLMN